MPHSTSSFASSSPRGRGREAEMGKAMSFIAGFDQPLHEAILATLSHNINNYTPTSDDQSHPQPMTTDDITTTLPPPELHLDSTPVGFDQALHEAILATLSHNTNTPTSESHPKPIITNDITTQDNQDDLLEMVMKLSLHTLTETDQSSSTSSPNPSISLADQFLCQICFETKSLLTESFCVKGCVHIYCNECMSSYVAAKLQDSVTHITCPSTACRGILEPYDCREILPADVFQRWGDVLCESLIAGSEKFYCPFKDCSALLIDGGGKITQSECPHCHRLFCAKCKCAWHLGMDCSEFQKLDKGERDREDIMLMNLAKNKKWKRCPKCKFFVEKSDGCMYMKCRCKFAFCYNCGAAASALSHICPKCKH